MGVFDEENVKKQDISKLSISTSKGFGGLNEDYFMNIQDKEKLEGIRNLLHDVKKQKRSNEKPQYDLLSTYQNGDTHGIHLYLGGAGEKSVIMYIGHEETAYYTSEEMTKQLRKIIIKKG
ncbi:hypothetical protein H9I32_11380 [Bacillus sp. Xin]|uniref:hypothetical protein n=1 Tax=unclassified Bacillus (in: firmicutes) TaxID=185979 RepID=UPI001573E7E5|nr:MULTISPECIES: hypothetical protein [unclassified Bacillus (in: firmicutes)]MBC6972960.1 hypothetical protein [Bacillus sp. Xin]NSW36541.1 hypothetical protein [Bacillus sp. Xin1]